jgi:hypothetical protein
MRRILFAFICCGVAIALLTLRRRAPENSSPATSDEAASKEIVSLRRDIEALGDRVRSVESPRMIPVEKRVAAANDSPPEEPVHPEPPVLRVFPTPQETAAKFGNYFDQIDALRGASSDTTMTGTFENALSKGELSDAAAGAPLKKVACNNGYCRVSLTYVNALDAESGRLKLLMTIGQLASSSSIYFNPDTFRVEGYFATDGKTLPPFPGSG